MTFQNILYGQGGNYITAANDRSLIKANAVTAGVRRILPTSGGLQQGDMAITPSATASTVNVGAGSAWIDDGAGGFYYVYNDGNVAVSPTCTSPTTTYYVYLQITDGGAAQPTITFSSTTSWVSPPAKALLLATVVGNASVIPAASITDKRTKAQLWDFSVNGVASVASPLAGNMVFDAAATTNGVWKGYDNSGAWKQFVSTVSGLSNTDLASGYMLTYQGTTAPASPTDGMLWKNTTTGVVSEYRASDSSWIEFVRDTAWGTWTPTLAQGGTAVGTTVNYARYVRSGRIITAQAQLTATAAGSGSGIGINFTGLPTPAQTGLMVGTAMYLNQGTGYFGAFARINSASFDLWSGNGTGNKIGQGTAFSISSTDICWLNITYEAAS